MGILIGCFILACGIATGLILGRLFCGWHHKNDTISQPVTIGEEVERRGCSPGCCDDNK